MMTKIRGSSNAKAKRELGWELRYPSWRDRIPGRTVTIDHSWAAFHAST